MGSTRKWIPSMEFDKPAMADLHSIPSTLGKEVPVVPQRWVSNTEMPCPTSSYRGCDLSSS